MDVGLGVVDLKTEDALAEAQQLAGDAVVHADASDDADDAPGAGDTLAGGKRRKTDPGIRIPGVDNRGDGARADRGNSRTRRRVDRVRRPCRGVAS